MKQSKDARHKDHMKQKKEHEIYMRGVQDGCRYTLLMSYAALVDEYNYDMVKLKKYRKRMNRYSKYVMEQDETGIDQDVIIKLMLEKGIDVTKIGDED